MAHIARQARNACGRKDADLARGRGVRTLTESPRGLTFRRLIDTKPATSWDEVRTGLKAVAPSVGFLAAEIVGGQCAPISSIEPKKPLALGSTFELYILEALAKQIAAGKHKWDDPIAIDDAKKSLPPGANAQRRAGRPDVHRSAARREDDLGRRQHGHRITCSPSSVVRHWRQA